MLSKPKHQHGMTLIELAIGLVVIAIVLAVGIPSFSTWIRNLHIRNAAQLVMEGLQTAKMEAVRRNTQVAVTLAAGGGWSVGCVTVVGTTCPAVIASRNAATGSAAVTVTTNNLADGKLVFDGSGRVASGLTANASPGLINITAGNDGDCAVSGGQLRCLRVVAARYGQVRMCDRALSDTSPNDGRACQGAEK